MFGFVCWSLLFIYFMTIILFLFFPQFFLLIFSPVVVCVQLLLLLLLLYFPSLFVFPILLAWHTNLRKYCHLLALTFINTQANEHTKNTKKFLRERADYLQSIKMMLNCILLIIWIFGRIASTNVILVVFVNERGMKNAFGMQSISFWVHSSLHFIFFFAFVKMDHPLSCICAVRSKLYRRCHLSICTQHHSFCSGFLWFFFSHFMCVWLFSLHFFSQCTNDVSFGLLYFSNA